MAYEQKPNTGSLFRNHKKENERHPDYKGSANVNGVEMWLSAWIKDGKTGKFMSLSFQPKEQKTQAPETTAPTPVIEEDDVPF